LIGGFLAGGSKFSIRINLKMSLTDFLNLLKKNARENYDFLSIAPFIGRWITFAFSVGVISGFIASAMDFFIENLRAKTLYL
jgi:hypothetical protein